MKAPLFIAVITGLIFLPCHIAMSANFIPAFVPFENITLQPGDFIQAGYAFGDFPMIYCFENNMQIDPPVGTIQWSFNGQFFSAVLSSTSLVIDTLFEGGLADPAGTISIQNITTIPLIVSCQFAF